MTVLTASSREQEIMHLKGMRIHYDMTKVSYPTAAVLEDNMGCVEEREAAVRIRKMHAPGNLGAFS